MSDFNCEIQIPDVKGLEPEKLTVGRIFYYHCTGDWPRLDVEKLSLQATSGTPYDLRLLGFELRDPKTADLKLVSYRPGEHKIEKVSLKDEALTLELPSFELRVDSVLPPDQKAEPFGPMGPLAISFPWVYGVIVISLLGIFLFSGLWFWKRRRDREETLKKIKKVSTGQPPLVQFHRELRILTKKSGLGEGAPLLKLSPESYLSSLRSLCEIYWGQKFHVAVWERPQHFLYSEFKSVSPKVYIQYQSELKFWDQKWNRLLRSKESVKTEDFLEFTLATRELIEKMEHQET